MGSAPYDARAIANFLLDRAEEGGFTLSITSLLKILYFAHGWHLAKRNQKLIGQPFEAWNFGPVVRVVYDQFKSESGGPLIQRAKSFDVELGQFTTTKHELSTEDSSFVLTVLLSYSKFHPYTLSDMTHDQDSPWTEVWERAELEAVPGMRIPDEKIKRYFLRLNSSDIFRV